MRLRKLVTVGALFVGVLSPAVPTQVASAASCSYPPNDPVLTFNTSAHTVTAGVTFRAYGKLTRNSCAIKSATVKLQKRKLVNGKPSGSWDTFKSVTTNTNGVYTTRMSLLKSFQLRARFAPTSKYPSGATSGVVNERVRTKITMKITKLSNCRLRFSGGTVPTKRDRKVYIQKRGPKGKFHGWTTVTTDLTNSRGHYSAQKKFTCGKTYNFAATIKADSRNLAGRSRTQFGVVPSA